MFDYILSSNIEIKTNNCKFLKKVLNLEMDRKKYDRTTCNIISDEKNKKIIIEIFAKDITSYKATINNIINLLELIFKTYEVNL